MDHYVGVDVSLERSSVCVVDATGRVVREAKVASEPEALVGFLAGLGVAVRRDSRRADPQRASSDRLKARRGSPTRCLPDRKGVGLRGAVHGHVEADRPLPEDGRCRCEAEGKRRSLVNAHSFRRWFITKAEQAGQAENIIAAVVGHKRPGMTFGVYSGGPSAEQLRACVEAVRLPD